MEFPAIAHMISWTVLIYLNLICSFATNRTVASSSASDSILKGCPQSVLDDPTGDSSTAAATNERRFQRRAGSAKGRRPHHQDHLLRL